MIGSVLIWATNTPGNSKNARKIGSYEYHITNRIANMVRYNGMASDWMKLSEITNVGSISIFDGQMEIAHH